MQAWTTAVLIIALFTFGSAIFYFLLLLERKTWVLVLHPDRPMRSAEDVRFVHRALQHFIPVLPPSNGVVVVGGLAAIIWQIHLSGANMSSLAVFTYWFLGQAYIIVFGHIAAAIKDVRATPVDARLDDVARGVRNLVRQHRNGFVHAFGVLVLEVALVLPDITVG